MPELKDYSGKFDPEFSHDKFNRETLLNLIKAYSEYIYRIDGFWYLTVMNKWGNDKALDCDVKVWEKGKAYETKIISNLLNIHGDDISTLMKYLQVYPLGWILNREINLTDNDRGILTNYTCPTLFSLEKEGKGREMQHCHVVCPKMLNIDAHYFNPNIKVTGLKVPPRIGYKDIACQWEFKLES